jgi:putative transposase
MDEFLFRSVRTQTEDRDSQSKVEQKLEYIHLNPMHERWNFVSKPEDYYWSSAKFYENGVDDFGIVTHYRDRF